MPKSFPSPSAAQLAALFNQLRQLESTGLPAFQALALLEKMDSSLKISLALMQRQLKSGITLSDSGFRAGLFDNTLRTLIHAAEASGQLTKIYGQLAEHYAALATRIAKIKSRLWLPGLTLVIALLVQPLPALVNAQISVGDYLYQSLGPLAKLAALVFLLLRLPGILRGLGMGEVWDRLQMAIPLLAQRIRSRQLNAFFFVLSMLLESGLAFSEAMTMAVKTIPNSAVRARFAPALAMLNSGASVMTTLVEVSMIDAKMLSVVNSSEQSGKLASGILHYTRLEAEALTRQDDTLATWLPRFCYALVAGWMVYSLLNGHPVTSA